MTPGSRRSHDARIAEVLTMRSPRSCRGGPVDVPPVPLLARVGRRCGSVAAPGSTAAGADPPGRRLPSLDRAAPGHVRFGELSALPAPGILGPRIIAPFLLRYRHPERDLATTLKELPARAGPGILGLRIVGRLSSDAALRARLCVDFWRSSQRSPVPVSRLTIIAPFCSDTATPSADSASTFEGAPSARRSRYHRADDCRLAFLRCGTSSATLRPQRALIRP
jgi:hypothetical protein